MRKNHRSGVSALMFGMAIALSGCASNAEPDRQPSSVPSPSASESAPADPVAALVTIGATSFMIADDSETALSTTLYSSSPETAIALLSTAFGEEPVLSTRPSDESCQSDASLATWADGFVLRYDMLVNTVPPGQLFEIESTVDTVGSIGVETPSGVSVGDSVDTILAGVPAEQISPPAATDIGLIQWVNYEVGSGTYSAPEDPNFGSNEYWGASARSVDKTIDLLSAPLLFQNLC